MRCFGTWFRALLYFSIAAIPVIIAELSKYKTFSDISDVTFFIIISNVLLQGIIAVRAFIDQSISRNVSKKDKKVVELITEDK